MKKLLKIVVNDWKNASRDKRELALAKECGFSVIVMAKGKATGINEKDIVDGFDVLRFSTRPLRLPRRMTFINRIISGFYWAGYAKKIEADVISCHDLLALMIGYLSVFILNNKALLIYDSHEMETARNSNRGRLQKSFVKAIESFLIKRTALNMMVCDSIADEVQRLYKLKTRPLVVRNIPTYWKLDEHEIEIKREFFRSKIKGIDDNGLIIMYHGSVNKGNGIDLALRGMSHTNNVGMVVLGSSAIPEYMEYLHQLIVDLDLSDRCFFHEAVPIEDLYKYVGAADVGMLTFEAITMSYFYTLPNKFFENIQALTPMICSDFPEMRKLAKKYNIALLCDPEDDMEIASCINKIQCDMDFRQLLKTNLIIAKEDLCWENEKKILEVAYKDIMLQLE